MKILFISLGCDKNLVDSEVMLGLLTKNGYTLTDDETQADVIVINTCCFIHDAKEESINTILEMAQYKEQNLKALVVAGCLAERYKDEILKEIPEIDAVLGTTSYDSIVEAVNMALAENAGEHFEHYESIDYLPDNSEVERVVTTGNHMAYLKIAEGCDKRCSYCIIPYARGRVRSRRFENVIAEVERLAANGFKEVVLTGIHLSSYGVDFEEATGLLELIQAVNAVKGIERIRLGSLEPKIVTEHFASELSKLDKICPHFHLSLQSGCDATLKRMNRKYTTKEYERGCELLRKYFVHPAITTDVIVGFPGETEEEFEQTKAYLEHIHFYEMHIFKYSKRKGTRAAVMPDQIDEQIKAARSEKLIALGHDMSKEFRKFYIGKNEEVLFEEKAVIGDKEYFVGYTKEYVKVAKKTDENLENQIVSGRISGMLTDEILLFE